MGEWPSSSPAASKVGRAVKSKDTKWEVALRSALWRRSYRFRKNRRGLPGTPDVVFPKRRLTVFLDSCFWHGCPDHCRLPKANAGLWAAKFARNRERDACDAAALEAAGWRVLRVWSHESDPLGVVLRALTGAALGPRLVSGAA